MTILVNVCAELEKALKSASGFTAYVFGSVLAGGSTWTDVDILLVAEDQADCNSLREALEPLAATVPLHVTIILQSEFVELGALAWGPLHDLAV